MIYLVPQFGLSNRLRSIVSAYSLSQKTNQKLCIIWEKNKDFDFEFNKFFKEIPSVQFCDKHFLLHIFKNNQNIIPIPFNRVRLVVFFFVKKVILRFIEEFNDELVLNKRFDNYFWELRKKNLYIRTCYDFYGEECNSRLYNQLFKLTDSLQQKVNQYILTHFQNKNVIGLHIRRTDNFESIKYSTDDLFIQQIKNFNSPNTFFYLATDDIFVLYNMKRYFNNNMLYQYEKTWDRISIEGINCAIIDLWLLKNTRFILGSYWSSYSKLAAVLGNIELKYVM